MKWDNLTHVLEEYAQKIRNKYQDRLISDDKIASGELLNSVEYIVEKDGTQFSVSLSLKDYWKYVEEGIKPSGEYNNPGWKAYPFILKWIDVKPVIPQPINGKLPTPTQLAYLITRKIVNEGYDGGKQLEMTLNEFMDEFEKAIDNAITKDIKEYLL